MTSWERRPDLLVYKWPQASARNAPGVYFEFFRLFDPIFLVFLEKISVVCESTAAEAANDRHMTENECRRKAERKAANRRRRGDPHKGPHKSGPPHRGPRKAANSHRTGGRRGTHTGNTQTHRTLFENLKTDWAGAEPSPVVSGVYRYR